MRRYLPALVVAASLIAPAAAQAHWPAPTVRKVNHRLYKACREHGGILWSCASTFRGTDHLSSFAITANGTHWVIGHYEIHNSLTLANERWSVLLYFMRHSSPVRIINEVREG